MREQRQSLERFLAEVEAKAYQMARIATSDREKSFDLVQEAMTRFVKHYADRPSEEYKPLFYKVLQNLIRDWLRKRRLRSKFMGFLPSFKEDGEDADPFQNLEDQSVRQSSDILQDKQFMRSLASSLRELPPRQREAFMLRAFEELSVEEASLAMNCSPSSVKTHYQRALQFLRGKLREHWS